MQNHYCFDPAKAPYQECLEHNRRLAEANPRTYLPDVAMTLINLSIFYSKSQFDQVDLDN